MSEPKRAVAYIRVSTGEQAKGFSLTSQKEDITNYAKQNNLQIIKIYKDASSGTKLWERDSIMGLLDDAEKKLFDVVLVWTRDRLARNAQHAGFIEITLEKCGIKVVSVNEPESSEDDEVNSLVKGILQLFADFENKRRLRRIKRGKEKALTSKKVMYNIPFGYKKIKNGYPEPDDNAKIVQKLFEYRLLGYSYRQLANKYNLTSVKVYRILKNPFYIGKLRWKGKVIEGNHEPIISKEEFDKVQNLRKKGE